MRKRIYEILEGDSNDSVVYGNSIAMLSSFIGIVTITMPLDIITAGLMEEIS